MSETKPNYQQITDYTVYNVGIETTKKLMKDKMN